MRFTYNRGSVREGRARVPTVNPQGLPCSHALEMGTVQWSNKVRKCERRVVKNYRAAGQPCMGTCGVTTSAQPVGVVLKDEQRFVRWAWRACVCVCVRRESKGRSRPH